MGGGGGGGRSTPFYASTSTPLLPPVVMPKVGSGDEASYADPDEFHDIRDSGTEDGWADFDTDNGWASRENVIEAQETPVQDDAEGATTAAPVPEVPAPEVPGDETVTEAPKEEPALLDAVTDATPPSKVLVEVRPTEKEAARPEEDTVLAGESTLGGTQAPDDLAMPLSAVSLEGQPADVPVEREESIEPAKSADLAELAEPAERAAPAQPAEATAPARPTKAAGRARTVSRTEPAEVAEPAKSAEAEVASLPAESAEASMLAEPEQASLPAESAEASQPAETEQASQLAEREVASLPAEPEPASQPAEPEVASLPAERAFPTEAPTDPSADTTVGADDTLAAAPAAELSGAAAPPADDDFDDFGDFAEQDDDFAAAADTPGISAPSSASASASATSLPPAAAVQPSVDVHAPREAIRATVAELLPDFVDASAPSSAESDLTREPLREIEGLAQVLTSDASRALFRELQTPVPIASTPLDWTRSATRRRHLISLGIPVNLDEVQQPAASRAVLPPLELHVEPVGSGAAAAGGASASATPAASSALPAEGAAPAEGWGARRRRELGGEPPAVSMERVEELVAIGEDQLTLKALPELRALAREMRTLSKQMSDLLAHHLMVREAFHADAEVYNAIIRDLVAGASTKHATTRKLEKRGLLSRAASLRRSRPDTPT